MPNDDQFERFGRKKLLKPDAVPDCNLPTVKLEAESSTNNDMEVTAEVIIGDRFKEDSLASPPVVLENLDRLCRLCLELDEAGTHLPLFGTEGIVHSIQQSIGIELVPDDPYPKQICPVCVERVNYIQRSREWFQKNDQLLRTLVVPEVSEASNDDLIIPDDVPATEAIFFKEEFVNAAEEIDDQVKMPKRKTSPAVTKSKSHKKQAICEDPNSFCTLCSREFETPQNLRHHLNAVHTGVGCKHCPLVFSHSETLKAHIKQHHWHVNRLAPWKQEEAKNLVREMSAKFNGGGVVEPMGEGSGGENSRR